MKAQSQLETLQLRAAMAEATARLLAAEQAAALYRRTTAEHLLVTHDLEDTLSRRSRSRSRSPPSPPTEQPSTSAPAFPSGVSDMARVVQYFHDHAAGAQAAADKHGWRLATKPRRLNKDG